MDPGIAQIATSGASAWMRRARRGTRQRRGEQPEEEPAEPRYRCGPEARSPERTGRA